MGVEANVLDINKGRVRTGRIVRKGIWVWSEILWILVKGE